MLILGKMNSSWMETKIAHMHFSMTCKIPSSSKGTMNSVLPLTWKLAILLKQRSTYWSGNTLQITMFYKKIDVSSGMVEKPTTMRRMINWKREECSKQKKLCIQIGMGNTQFIWKMIEERERPQDQLQKIRKKEERPKIRSR